MKEIFSKINFPTAPDLNIYHWKEADTEFEVPISANYVIAITASAKSAKQNKSNDDDDLRVSIDNYEFGKYEIHEEQISWKGFGTSSSWDGASLKGNKKTIYYFLEFQKGKHTIQFFADETPAIEKLQVFQLEENEKFEVNTSLLLKMESDKKGIPCMSFVFLGVKPKDFRITAECKSGKQKKTNDGDNLKVVINGKILQNTKAPTSDKYKNFYFSGDLNKDKSEVLKIEPKKFEFLEDSVELWYDESPSVHVNIDFYDNIKDYFNDLEDIEDKKIFIKNSLTRIANIGNRIGLTYSSYFLYNSLNKNTFDVKYDEKDKIVDLIKNDKNNYSKILELIKTELKAGILNGEIILDISTETDDKVNFESFDLSTSIHGIKRIKYNAIKQNDDNYKVEFILIDIYDFKPEKFFIYGKSVYGILKAYMVNLANEGENLGVVKNFIIEIKIIDYIAL